MIVFSNYDMKDYYDLAKDELAEEVSYGDRDDFDDLDIDKRANTIMEDDWYNLIDHCLLKSGYKYFVFGSLGRWDGNYDGWTVIDTDHDFYDLIDGCAYVELNDDDDGRIFLKCSHHDGTNYFEFKALTDKGIEIYRNATIFDDNKELGKLLGENSVPPRIEWCY